MSKSRCIDHRRNGTRFADVAYRTELFEEEAMSSDPNRTEDTKPAEHSDNEKSKLPERNDEGRKQAPHDNPGKKPGEGEAPVG
jgi:hypothetical protein